MLRSLVICLCIVTFLLASDASAQPQLDSKQPVLMEAERMGYDRANRIVVALGKVEIVQGDTLLLADRIAYYQDQNIVRAKGNVTMVEPNGTVYFAEEVELKDDLKQGVVANFRIRMSDNSLFAAREAERVDANTTKLRKAVYSPCKLCTDDEGKAGDPLWQIKANKVKIDETEQTVTYRDAYFEVYGTPVAYTPYFSHPTPNADRKSGVLSPEYSQSSQLGTVAKVPYYWNIAPDRDATITPHITSEEGPVLEAEYRQLTDNGQFQFNGSATYPRERDAEGKVISGNQFRGHLFAKGMSQLDEDWNWGFDVNRASDDTYLRRYRFGSQESLTSRLYTEYVHDRDYLLLQTMAFQGLEAGDVQSTIPYILPGLKAESESRPLWGGARFRVGTNTALLTRRKGTDTRRASFDTGLRLPYTTSGGHVLEADANLRTDVYSVSELTRSNGQVFDGTESRMIPTLALRWKYPLIKQVQDASLIVEPLAELVASSNGNNPETIPNEDSLHPELSDINLFSDARFAGADRVENGTHLIYGVRSQYQFAPGKNLNAMLGQNYQLTGDPVFPLASDGTGDMSDYVGRVGVQYDPVDLSYRFRMDDDDFGLRRSEVRGAYFGERVSAALDYIYIDHDPFLETRRNILGSGSVRLDDHWTWLASGQRDLDDDSTITASTGFIFYYDCITVLTQLRRDFIRDRDIEPDTSISVRLSLKNLN